MESGEIEEKFIVTAPYGTSGSYPSASSSVEHSSYSLHKILSGLRFGGLTKFTKMEQFMPKNVFLNILEVSIQKLLEDKEVENNSIVIKAMLVQNYSPCNFKDNVASGCADDILEFKKKREEEGIKFSLTVRFANFYKHYIEANMEGLAKLLRNGVNLELLQGEDKWKEFLSDKAFIKLDPPEYNRLLKRATNERVEREKQDQDKFDKLRKKVQGK